MGEATDVQGDGRVLHAVEPALHAAAAETEQGERDVMTQWTNSCSIDLNL